METAATVHNGAMPAWEAPEGVVQQLEHTCLVVVVGVVDELVVYCVLR